MTTPSRRPTGADVAKRAGVSQSAVSLVLSGKAEGRISDSVADRINAAAQELGYRPHTAASRLRTGGSRVVGLFVPDVTNPFIGHVLRGAQREAREHGLTVALIEPGPDHAAAVDAVRAADVDGVLLFAPDPAVDTAGLGPAVLLDAEDAAHESVVLDHAQGMQAAVNHLTSLGHKRIAYLQAAVELKTFKDRQQHATQLLGRLGTLLTARSSFDVAAAKAATRTLLDVLEPPTALLCDDDLLAAGAMQAANELGFSIPGRLSVVGFGGSLLGEVTTPALTSVLAPAEDIGATGIKRLIALQADPAAKVARTVLPLRLAARGSTGRPEARAVQAARKRIRGLRN